LNTRRKADLWIRSLKKPPFGSQIFFQIRFECLSALALLSPDHQYRKKQDQLLAEKVKTMFHQIFNSAKPSGNSIEFGIQKVTEGHPWIARILRRAKV
jgi:hypothetical protein